LTLITKIGKQIFLILSDVVAVNLAFLVALYIHFEGQIPSDILVKYYHCIFLFTVFKIIIYRYFDLYNSLWAYASVDEMLKILLAGLLSGIASTLYLIYMGVQLYFGVYLISTVFEIVLIGSVRFSYRFFRRIKNKGSINRKEAEKKILIIGSGSTATLIATEIKNHTHNYGRVIGFIDDDESKLHKSISGNKVLGNTHDIYSIAHRQKIDEIIIATPTVEPAKVRMILEECKRTTAKVRIMPGIREMIDGQVSLNKIRDVEIEDLLGRDTVNLNVQEVTSYLENQVVLVTGGGGSIGSELCRQIAKFNPQKLIIVDIYENTAYDIQNELIRDYGSKLNLDVIIASVRERETIFKIIETNHPDVIFHAAAHKHVPMMERSPSEAIKNNVFGTKNVAEAADKYGVKRFVQISTDKAVNPTNMMGASKRICEMIIQGLAKQSKTKFTAVRFGNVLGSNGSVVPLFKKQIQEGGPVTVTHREIIRYFMTITEAVQLVIQSGAIAKGGEIFVLDMGKPVKIYDLAVDLIKLSGLKLDEDIEIVFTGLRPGEKLFEELLMDEEGLHHTLYNKIKIGKPTEIDYSALVTLIDELQPVLFANDTEKLYALVKKIVPTFGENSQTQNPKHIKEIKSNIIEYKAK
jgi:FlaA1/EpsC-like NDP-sugar epimerase